MHTLMMRTFEAMSCSLQSLTQMDEAAGRQEERGLVSRLLCWTVGTTVHPFRTRPLLHPSST
jgi:hypothetical protein